MRPARSARLGVVLTLSLVPLAVIVGAPAASAARSCHGHAATLVGTRGDDVLRGTSGDDVLIGLGGNDVLRGLGGNDVLCGSDGDDRLLAGAGNDVLDGGEGTDALTAGGGADLLFGDDGDDALDGGNGVDEVSYDRADDGVTIELLRGTASGFGEDTLAGLEVLSGSDFDDEISGGQEAVTILGGQGDDTLTGGRGDDVLEGGDGDDAINGGPGAANVVTYARAPAAVTVDLTAGTAIGWGSDTVSGISIVVGSEFGDTLSGGNRRETFLPGAGDDVVKSLGSPDAVDYSDAPNGVVVDLAAGTATGDGADTLTDITSVTGSAFADTLTGTDRRNTIVGGAGDDVLVGGDGDDELDGGEGIDSLDGGAGTDVCLNAESVVGCE